MDTGAGLIQKADESHPGIASHDPTPESQPLSASHQTLRKETIINQPNLHTSIHPLNLIDRSPSGPSLRTSLHSADQEASTSFKPTLIRSRSTSSQHAGYLGFKRQAGLEDLSTHDHLQDSNNLIDEHRPLPRRSPIRSQLDWSARTTTHRIGRLVDSLASFNPTSLTVTINPSSAAPTTPMILRHPSNQTGLPTRSRWFTVEFGVYWLVLAYALITIVVKTMNLSQVDHLNYDRFKHKLSKGWIFDRKIDNSDQQYRRFRTGISQLGLLAIVYLSLSNLSRYFQVQRTTFQSLISAVILTALHGTSVLKIMCIIGLNYLVSRLCIVCPARISSILVWVINLMILFANDYWGGYRFDSLSPALAFLDNNRFRGLIPRWQIGFNISMLRLISYSLDYQWASTNNWQIQASSKSFEPEYEKERVKNNRVQPDYCFQNYFNYVFYPPLYIAGPIITFNNFVSQMNRKPNTITSQAVIGYVGRFLICFFTLEWILHYMYVVAIKDSRAWQGNTPLELGIIGYWNLIIIWLKLLIPWRFFRLWALLDGIDPPENMIRCMSNNYSTLEFWRSWHRSYNLWIVRYLYIPLGGSKNMILSTVIVFTFVALWHDLSFKLLTWGWLVSFFVLPEVIAKKMFSNSSYRSKPWFRHLVALGGTLNVMTMMSANLVGFSIGTEGVQFMWNELLSSWSGLKVLFAILGVVYCAVHVMIEYREVEAKQGICRKC